VTRRVPALLVAGVACAALAAAAAAAPPNADGVWVDGVVHNLVVTGPAPAGARATTLYVIAPISPAHPLHPLADAIKHGFGAHDHVIGLAHPGSIFHGACELTLVVPGPKAVPGKTVGIRLTLTPAGKKPLLDAARLGGKLLPLDAAARIEKAKRLGLATLVDTRTLVACTVSPR
jgi:hypothetical protein